MSDLHILGTVRCRLRVGYTGLGRDENIEALYSRALAGGNLTLQGLATFL